MAVELTRPKSSAEASRSWHAGRHDGDTSRCPSCSRTTPVFSGCWRIGLATNQDPRLQHGRSPDAANTAYSCRRRQPASSTRPPMKSVVDEKLGYQPVTSKFSDPTACNASPPALLAALDGIKEGNGTLLDHSLVMAYTDCQQRQAACRLTASPCSWRATPTASSRPACISPAAAKPPAVSG